MKSPWPETQLGDILTERRASPNEEAVLSGRQPIIAKIRFADGGMEFRASGESKTNLISIHPGDLVLSGINAAKGAIALYEPVDRSKAAATIHYSSYSMDRERVEPRFLWLLLRHDVFRERLERFVPNGIKTELKASKFLSIPIPLPPLPEQRRIAAKINRIASRVEEAKRLSKAVRDNEEILLEAIISDLLSDFPLEGRLQDVLLSKPRNGWSPNCNGDENGTPVLTLSAVYRFAYNPLAYKITSEQTACNAHYWLSPGDLLISRSNSIDLVGNAAIYSGSPNPCIYPDLLMRLSINNRLADCHFVHYWLQSRTVRQYIKANAKGTSPSMKKISQSTVSAIPWPKGISVSNQKEYVGRINMHEKAIRKLNEHHDMIRDEVDALMPALLDQAFRGEI